MMYDADFAPNPFRHISLNNSNRWILDEGNLTFDCDLICRIQTSYYWLQTFCVWLKGRFVTLFKHGCSFKHLIFTSTAIANMIVFLWHYCQGMKPYYLPWVWLIGGHINSLDLTIVDLSMSFVRMLFDLVDSARSMCILIRSNYQF